MCKTAIAADIQEGWEKMVNCVVKLGHKLPCANQHHIHKVNHTLTQRSAT